MRRVDTTRLRKMYLGGLSVRSPHGKGRSYSPKMPRGTACKNCCMPMRGDDGRATECIFNSRTVNGTLAPYGLCIPVYDDSFMADLHCDYVRGWVLENLMEPKQEELRCKCTRCRNTHAESDRTWSPPDKDGGRHGECPRCGGRTFTRVKDDQQPTTEHE